jgi:hypothetical protein
MKKYLINGALALLAGAFLVCCAEKESDFVPLAQQKAMDFEEVFKEIYGEIDPYQDWGFKSGKIEIDPNDSSVVVEVEDVDGDIAYTRVAPFGGNNYLLAFNGGTRGANTNHNLWGDPNADNGKWHYKVPPALTDRQKLRVKLYFQYNPWLTYEDPGYTDFFVQQVYKGGTSPIASQSLEVYPTGDNGSVVGGKQMDKLTVGTPGEGGEATNYYNHVNDFNNGDYNGGKTVQVLNTGGNTNNAANESHPDQITLMLNSKTDCVGYWSSNGSTGHNERCALAGADVIDQWASSAAAQALGIDLGDAVYDENWDRSFVGLDYDGVYGTNIYKTGTMVNGSWDNNAIAYAKFSDARQKEYIWDGTRVWGFDEYIAAKGEYFLDKEGNKVPYTISDRNMFIGTNCDLSGQSAYMPKKYIPALGREDDVIDITVIQAKIDEGALPCDGKLYQWTKNIGGRDHVYSDWIVTLTNAGQTKLTDNTFVTYLDIWTQKESGRVFCEDLGRASREDLDYNDAVFDVTIWENYTYRKEWWEKYSDGVRVDSGLVANAQQIPETRTYYANVNLLAAGGTIPITVAGQPVHVQFDPNAAVETMINTRDNNSTAYGSYATYDPVQLDAGANTTVRRYRKVKNVEEENQDLYELKLFRIEMPVDSHAIITIPIVSSFGEAKQIQTIEGLQGNVPRKFMVPNDLPNHPERMWTSERKNISLAYPKFKDWVNGKITLDSCFFGANSVNTNYTYQGKDYVGNKLPLVMKAQRTIVTDGEQYLWSGTIEYGDVWNLRNTEADLESNQENTDFKQFYPGDRLRFRATGIKDDAWISVAVGNIKPYFVDSEFPNYVYNADGSKETRDEGCVEVLLDEDSAAKLNENVSNGKITFQVQGRNFTLTGITRVLFQ